MNKIAENTPFAVHGELAVEGAYLVDKNGEKMQLRGMSTHGIAWRPDYINFETFKFLRDSWNNNCVRLAMYTHESGGYCTDGDREKLKKLVKNGVEYATELGMYVIVDWHVLNEKNPLVYKDDAAAFFDEMSRLYAGCGNVIYEICNEPNSAPWEDIAAYADEIIPIIRANSGGVIIVGTPDWSQGIDKAAVAPLNYENIMYALHFYAATHTDRLRDRMSVCVEGGLPVFISEFGTCDASGGGKVDREQSEKWKKIIDKYGASYMCWNLSNTGQTCSIISRGCDKLSGWTAEELSEQGRLVAEWFKSAH
ncbi:MAG: glycoside hydrolase family 5 protein [Ruminococcus sp.]|nr:glycoside hydrolase family 5 protein [Ruminococcus sp.]MCM1479959.1 glycoside hydrolase family 5 protein [Muribaculaceae bacterium]